MKLFFLSLLLIATNVISAQNVSVTGKVKSLKGGAIPFVKIIEINTKKGTVCDANGDYNIFLNEGDLTFKISAMGYQQMILALKITKDTIVDILMNELEDILDEVVISGTLDEISMRESPIPIEVYTADYLNKVPVAGLLEATQNINGVRPQLNCAVCNTGDIHINGMEGPYTMVTIDGMPVVGGLSSVYGLQGIPSSLLQRVEVVKGPSSTLYGSEAVAGLVNVITKSIDCSPKFSMNLSSTSWREIQTDFMFKYAEKKKISGVFAVDYHNYSKPIDKNGDNFTDLTLKDRVSLFNKLEFKRSDNRLASLSARYLYEDRWGGEMQWEPVFRGGDSIYGESIYTNRAELIGVYQLPTKEKLKLSASYSFHSQDSRYGITKYDAIQHIAYGQLVWHKKIGAKNNIVSGLAVRYNYYDDNTLATRINNELQAINNPDDWVLPGVFIQDNISITKKMNLLVGSRLDLHSKHGHILSPRINWKWSPSEKFTFRMGYGNGFRVVNVFSEDHAALTGAREIIFQEDLNPEKSNNININIEKRINTSWSFISFDASVFYTHFSNKIIPDFNINDDQIVYSNLDGYAVSRGISVNTKILFDFPLKINIGSTILDVFSMKTNTIGQWEKEEQLFTEPFACTWSASYYFLKQAFSIDYTGNIYGPMKLPLLENDFRPEYSTTYSIQNIKFTKEFDKGFDLYFGVRNLLNFTPANYSILRAHDPFDKLINDPIDNPNNYSFDPSYIYTSFQGITFFIGFKYVIN